VNIALSTSVIQRGKTGIAQYVFALVRALLDQNLADRHRLHLLVLEEDLPLFEFARDRLNLVPVPESYRPAIRNILWHQKVLPRLVRQHGWDLVHIPSYRRLLWPRPCPLTATIHDLAPFRVAGKYDPLRMFYGRVVVRQLARRQNAIIAISRNTAVDIQRHFGLGEPRVRVVHNGLDHERFQPGDPAAARARVGARFGLDQPFFLYVSRLEHPGKNHLRLIEAFNRFKSASGSSWLLALGGADWSGAEVVRRAAAESPFSADIRFLGFVPDSEVPALYRAAGVFTYPSLYEGFGFPPLEAMACGCPVLSSTRGALAEVVGDAAEVIEPEDPDSIARALGRMATEEPLRARRIAAGFSNARRFQWDRCARETLAIWEETARRR
jgi:glycosyltransferase involved in cell wall biosynthesis